MDARISQLTTTVLQVLLVWSVPVINSSMLIPCLKKISGEASECKGFLLQCSLFFTAQMGTTDEQKIAQFINLLTRKVLKWVIAMWEKGGKLTTSYNHFVELFCQVFIHTHKGVEVGEQLLAVKQGRSCGVCTGISHARSQKWMEQDGSKSSISSRT